MTAAAGVGVFNVPADTYHADKLGVQPTLSSSIAKILCTRSPLHARTAHPRLNPDYQRVESDKFDLGSAVHAILLEGDDSKVDVLYFDNWRSKAAKEARDEARANGMYPLLACQWEDVRAMLAAVRLQLDGLLDVHPAPLTGGLPEQTLVWEDRGVLCRARLDWLHDDLAAVDDVKSTSASADPDAWTRTLFNMGFDIQAAFYLRGVRSFGGDPELRFIVMETTPPYAVSVVGLAPSVLELADAKVEWALDLWRRCVQTGVWPAYPSRVCFAELPGWAEAAWLEKEARLRGEAA